MTLSELIDGISDPHSDEPVGRFVRTPAIRFEDCTLLLSAAQRRRSLVTTAFDTLELRFGMYADHPPEKQSFIDMRGVHLTDPGGDTTAAAMLALAVLAGRRDALPALIDEVKAVYDIP